MKKTLKSRKFLTLLLALMMVLAILPISASAADGDYLQGNAIPPDSSNPYGSAYLQPNPVEDEEITVTLIIEAGDVVVNSRVVSGTNFHEERSVTLGDGENSSTYTVADLLYSADTNNADFTFYGISGLSLIPFTSSTDYLAAVKYGTNTWQAGRWGFDGWVFRINDKYPVKVTDDGLGYEGTSILQTYLEDGDVVHLFYDFPSTVSSAVGDVSANYVRGVYESSTDTTLTAQLQGHKTYITPSTYIMNIYNYIDLGGGVTAQLYDVTGTTPVGTAATSSTNGEVTFTGAFAPGETYVLKTDSVLRTVSGSWASRINHAYFVLTGAYSIITIPTP
ncbi:MAG TPA: hypothetical protein VN381_16630 [Anaerovoracaceae bacterium]|nr:hypothetical protein [Anaerovoracaceae bacterium]